ncbi:hypothetical protein BH09VER1_BH09VER1_31930 [soil metagenome]
MRSDKKLRGVAAFVAFVVIVSSTPFIFAAIGPSEGVPLLPVEMKDEKAVVAEASRAIPYFDEFRKIYPQATIRAFLPISIVSTPETEKEVMERLYVCAIVGLYDRYVLTMYVTFKMSPDQKTVTSFVEPQFGLQEINRVGIKPIDGLPGGQANIEYGPAYSFDYTKFKIWLAHGEDFSSIGLTVRKDAPVDHFDRVWKPHSTPY